MPPSRNAHGLTHVTIQRLRSHQDRLVITVLQHIDETYAWYRALSAGDRSWVSVIARSSIDAFIDWCEATVGQPMQANELLSAAPPELARTVSLQQALQLVRTGVDVLEHESATLSATGNEQALRDAVLRYSRDFAFAAAEVYARAAEARGTWDARLEATVVDGILRGEDPATLSSRASALSWSGNGQVLAAVAAGSHPTSPTRLGLLRRQARGLVTDVLVGAHSDRVFFVLGGPQDLVQAARELTAEIHAARIVIGPLVPDFAEVGASITACQWGLTALAARPEAPGPTLARDLLPERVLAGDRSARTDLIRSVYRPLVAIAGDLLQTLSTYLDLGRSLEGAAKALYVHPNTVRYRLRKVHAVCELDPMNAREAYILRIGLAVGRLDEGAPLSNSDKRAE